MKPSWVYLAFTAAFVYLALVMVADRRGSAGPEDGGKGRIDRSDAIEIATRLVNDDPEPPTSRAIIDSMCQADGNWTIWVRWFVEGSMFRVKIVLSPTGDVLEYNKS